MSLRGYPSQVFVLSLATYTTAQMDLALFGYAVPYIREEFELTLSAVMSIVSGAFVIGGVLIVGLGLLTDRLGRRAMLLFSMIGSSLLVALHAVVPNPATLMLLRGASIGVGGLTYPVTGALIAEEFPARRRGLFLGFLQTGYPLGWALASVVAAWMLSRDNWRLMFLFGLASLPLSLVVWRVLREPQRFLHARGARSRQGARFRELLAPGLRGRLLTLFCAQFLFVWAYAASIFLFPSYLREVRGLQAFDFSVLIGAGNAIGVLGYLLAAVTGEFWLTRRTTVVLWTLLGALLFQCLVWWAEGFSQLLLCYGVMSMFFYGVAAVKFAYLAEIVPTRVRATAMAVCGSLAVTLGSAAGPLMVARAVESVGWPLGYSALVGIPLVMAGLLYLLLTPLPSGLEVEEIQTLLNPESPVENTQ